MSDSVVEAVESDIRPDALGVLAETLAEAISKVDLSQVPPLAARLVDVLKRVGGDDLETLRWLRSTLAVAVDRLAEVQGMRDDNGKPLGTALAPMVRQLVEVIETLDRVSSPSEVSPLDEIAAARARRTAARQSAASGSSLPASG